MSVDLSEILDQLFSDLIILEISEGMGILPKPQPPHLTLAL